MGVISLIRNIRGLRIVISFLVASNLCAVWYALYASESFRSSVTILPVVASEGGGGLESNLGSLGGLASSVGVSLLGSSATEVKGEALLGSADTMIGFINRYDLSPVILKSQEDADFESRTVKYFRDKHINISKNLRDGTTVVSFTWPDRERVSFLANSYVDYVNQIYAEREIALVERRLAFLSDEIDKVSEREIREALYRMIEIELQKKTRINTSPAYAYEVVESAREPYRRAWPRRGFIVSGVFAVSLALSLMALAVLNLRLRNAF